MTWIPLPGQTVGNSYTGDFVNGVLSGLGKMLYFDGTTYDGGWKDNGWYGQGLFAWPDGTTFEGDMISTHNGHGILTYPAGFGVYTGDIRSLVPEGQGSIVYGNGFRYEGDWVAGSQKGTGKFTWPSGETLEGTITGWLSGNGVLSYVDGNVYTGDVLSGMPEGMGRMVYVWGAAYEGGWSGAQWSGTGTVVWNAGFRFEGDMTSTGNGTGTFYNLNDSTSFACNLVAWVPYPA